MATVFQALVDGVMDGLSSHVGMISTAALAHAHLEHLIIHSL
jgi:hypothetical protein